MDISCDKYQKTVKNYGKAMPVARRAGAVSERPFVPVGILVSRWRRALRRRTSAVIERLLCIIDRILEAWSASRVVAVIRAAVCALCFFGIVAIIGGMERGSVGMGAGAAAALAITAVEFIFIKKGKTRRSKNVSRKNAAASLRVYGEGTKDEADVSVLSFE